MKMSIAEIQEIINKMLDDVSKACEESSVTYYCQAGTVLGTIRHSGPIPWDYDADIIVPNNQIDNFVKCIEEKLSDKYYVDYYKVNKKGLRQFPRVGLKGYKTRYLHLDVFRLIGLPDEREEQLKIVKEANYYTSKNRMMRAKLISLLFRGHFKEAAIKAFNKYYYINKFEELCNRYDYDRSTYVMNPSGKYKAKNIFDKKIYGEGIKKDYAGFKVIIPSSYDFYLKQYYGDYMSFPPQEEIEKEMNKEFIIEKQ